MAKIDQFPKRLAALKSLRDCQRDALENIQKWLRRSEESTFLTCMPTGTGKTGVVAITSVMFAQKDVLIVTPWDNLRRQMVNDLNKKFWENSRIPKPPGFRADAFSGEDLAQKLAVKGTRVFWVTTFQGLWTISRREDLFKQLQERIDLVIIDEGHYEPAMWWGRAVKALEMRTLLLTATPYRNDLKYFRIKETSVSHFKYKDGIAAGIIRQVDPQPLGEESSSTVEVAKAIAKKWSKRQKAKLANSTPRMIVCCRDFTGVKDYTRELNKLGINAIGIHHRATKKNIPQNELKFFRNKVPTKPENEKADVWVHERMLTEGLDFPPFCALVVTWYMRNDRKLIQQIGRVVRTAGEDRNNRAIVYEVNGAAVASSWQSFLEFENDFRVVTPEYFRTFVDKHLERQPRIEYFGKRFRRQLVPAKMDEASAKREILTVTSVIVRRVGGTFDLNKFIGEVTDSLQLEDYITVGPNDNAPVVGPSDIAPREGALWLYCRLLNSRTLLSHAAYEVKLSALCVVLIRPFLFLTDTDSYIPAEPLDEEPG